MPTAIEWTEETWNPLAGCQWASPGCDGCYAARDAAGRLKGIKLYAGLTELTEADPRPRFTGEIRTVPERLDQPLRWARGRRIFVNSMSDLFHPRVPVEFVAEVYARMALSPQHQFQVLTKRPARMAALSHDVRFVADVQAHVNRRLGGVKLSGMRVPDWYRTGKPIVWPLPNVWHGTSVESASAAGVRMRHLARTATAVRWVSAEPLIDGLQPSWGDLVAASDVHWVVVGGESGPLARPMRPEWARQALLLARAGGARVLFKQWGEWVPRDVLEAEHPDHPYLRADLDTLATTGKLYVGPFGTMLKVGKRTAGRTLDGRTWDEYPA